jgi:hypothetical protein
MPRRTVQSALDELLSQGLRSECSSSGDARKKIILSHSIRLALVSKISFKNYYYYNLTF